jgi:hypothetical protein
MAYPIDRPTHVNFPDTSPWFADPQVGQRSDELPHQSG